MRKFFESIKDFIYDSVDYIIVLSIIGIVVVIIGWRIDLLFANDIPNAVDDDNQVAESIIEDDNVKQEILEDKDHVDKIIDVENEKETVEIPNNEDEPVVNTTTVRVTIPSGSLPSKIGSILEDKGLILSKSEFVEKSQELKLDTKLKSGDFDISIDSTIEEIIYLISK